MKRGRVMELTETGLELLMDALGSDRERAGEEYNRLRSRLTVFFCVRGDDSPESGADETIDRVAARLAAGEAVLDVRRYSLGVARLVALERYRAHSREAAALEEFAVPPPAADPECELRFELLARCLAEMSPEDRWLLVNYYEDLPGAQRMRQRRELAARLNLSLNLLRLRVHRLRLRLEARLKIALRQSG